jgi:DNA-binding transcriptional MerR regulator
MHAEARVDRQEWPYRMKDLCDLTGLPRQVIHFYIQQGLVPEGRKTGRNMAYYGDEHLERVRLVRKLQHERFLPLKAIKAVIEGRDEMFSPAQRDLLVDVKRHLERSGVAPAASTQTLELGEAMRRAGVDREDVRQLVEQGLVAHDEGDDGEPRIAVDSMWLLELLGQLRKAGFTRALGFEARELAMYEEAIAALFRKEAALLTRRLAELPPAEVAEVVERSLPIVGTLLARWHDTKARELFAAL